MTDFIKLPICDLQGDASGDFYVNTSCIEWFEDLLIFPLDADPFKITQIRVGGGVWNVKMTPDELAELITTHRLEG